MHIERDTLVSALPAMRGQYHQKSHERGRRVVAAATLAALAVMVVVALTWGRGGAHPRRTPVSLEESLAEGVSKTPRGGAGATAAAAVPDATLDATEKTLKLLSAHHVHAAAAKMEGSKASTGGRSPAVDTKVPAEKLAAAEVSRVLAAALSKAAMADKAGNGKHGGTPTYQLAEETDKEVREAAEAEAEKDAITAGEDDDTAMSAPKVAPAGPNQVKNERMFDKTGLKKKPVKQPAPKLSKGVLEAMKTGLEAGWAEERRAKEIAKKEAAVFYAKLRKKMLLMDEERHVKELGTLAAQKNQTTSQGNSHLLDLLDKVYQTDEPTPTEVKKHLTTPRPADSPVRAAPSAAQKHGVPVVAQQGMRSVVDAVELHRGPLPVPTPLVAPRVAPFQANTAVFPLPAAQKKEASATRVTAKARQMGTGATGKELQREGSGMEKFIERIFR